jgi:predicted phage terminase large subunit-like protein
MHYDLIIADDLHSERNVTNKEQIEQVIDHYKLAFSLLDPGKPFIIIGTRWDYSDLYQHILDFEADDFNILKKSAYNDDGSLFFPEVLNEMELDKIRRRQGTSIFSKQYLNEPVSDENATFKRDKIVRKPWDEVKNRPVNWYLSVDPSYEGTYSDFAALVIAGMDYQRDLYVKHVVRKKLTYGEIIQEIFKLYTESDVRIQKILIETVATQKSIGIELANEQKRRNTWLPIQEIRSRQQSKEERIRGLAPFYEFNHIFHVKECPQIEELEYELLHFPTGRHDDVVDALANILEVASPPMNRQTPYDRERKRNNPLAWKPKSAITGY